MTGIKLFTGSRHERADAARDLGMLTTNPSHPDTTRIVVLLSRTDGIWRGTIQSKSQQIENFDAASIEELQIKMCALAMMLAAPLADDETWRQSQRDSIIADEGGAA